MELANYERKMSCNKPGYSCLLRCKPVVWQERICPETVRHHSVYTRLHFFTSQNTVFLEWKMFVRDDLYSLLKFWLQKEGDTFLNKKIYHLSAAYMECGSKDDIIIVKSSLICTNNHRCDWKAIKICSTIFRRQCRAKLQKMTIRE
jgi:hypothetical protein